MVRIKICGVTTYEDAHMAAAAGADLLGFNCYRQSPRYLAPEAATAICDRLRAALGERCPLLVGVFVNEVASTVSALMNRIGLDFAQLSGDESDDMMQELHGLAYKAVRPMNKAQALDDVQYFAPLMPVDERVPSLLLDAYHPKLYGGTGEQASTEVALAVKAQVPRLMLAGGLTPENVAGRIAAIAPWGVDVASGVEALDKPGSKDAALVAAFIAAVRGTLPHA